MTAPWPLAALAARAAQARTHHAAGPDSISKTSPRRKTCDCPHGSPAPQVLLITSVVFGSSLDIAVGGQQGNSLLAPWPATAASWVEA